MPWSWLFIGEDRLWKLPSFLACSPHQTATSCPALFGCCYTVVGVLLVWDPVTFNDDSPRWWDDVVRNGPRGGKCWWWKEERPLLSWTPFCRWCSARVMAIENCHAQPEVSLILTTNHIFHWYKSCLADNKHNHFALPPPLPPLKKSFPQIAQGSSWSDSGLIAEDWIDTPAEQADRQTQILHQPAVPAPTIMNQQQINYSRRSLAAEREEELWLGIFLVEE